MESTMKQLLAKEGIEVWDWLREHPEDDNDFWRLPCGCYRRKENGFIDDTRFCREGHYYE